MMVPESTNLAAFELEDGTTLEKAMRAARAHLTACGREDGVQAVRLLMEAVTGLDMTAMMRDGKTALSEEQRKGFAAFVTRHGAGEPVGRMLGRRAFHDIELVLSPDTLEPRPDSELVVDLALEYLPASRPGCDLHVLDLGTGTGALLLAVLHARADCVGIGIDLAAGAVETARTNAARLGLEKRAFFVRGSWDVTLEQAPAAGFDLIVSNPPYIASHAVAGLARDVRAFDPHLALDGGADGLDAYRAILAGLDRQLARDGVCIFEMGFDQGEVLQDMVQAHGLVCDGPYRDLGGQDRALVVRKALSRKL